MLIQWINTDYIPFVALSFVGSAVFVSIYSFLSNDKTWLATLWNLFLAFVPLLIAVNLKSAKEYSFVLYLGFLLLWLLFFPNAFYMVTDLKYLSNHNIGEWKIIEKVDKDFWIRWIFICSSALIVFSGLLYGGISFVIVKNELVSEIGNGKFTIIMPVICFLSGFAIYIGRFARVNSWDVLRPIFLAKKIIESLKPSAYSFILIFSVLSGILCLITESILCIKTV